MERLNRRLQLASFFVVMSAGFVQAMESPSQGEIRNAFVRDVQAGGFPEDFVYFPTDCAIDVIVSMDKIWMAQYENRCKLIELAQFRMDVVCGAVEKIKDLRLAWALARQGKITKGVASIIVNAFLNTGIKTCLSDFSHVYAQAFPETSPGTILRYGNHAILYKVLADVVTKNVWYDVEPIVNCLFSEDDFSENLSAKEMADYIGTLDYRDQFVCATVDADRIFFVTGYKGGFVKIYNRRTGLTLRVIPKSIGISEESSRINVEKLALKKDNPASLGILDTEGKIHVLPIPVPFLQSEVPLKELAALVYCNEQARKKTESSAACIGYAIFESQDCGEEEMLKVYMDKRRLSESCPSFLSDELICKRNKITEIIILRAAFEQMAQKLGVTRKQVAIDLYVDNKKETWKVCRTLYTDWKTSYLVQSFGGTFIDWLYKK